MRNQPICQSLQNSEVDSKPEEEEEEYYEYIYACTLYSFVYYTNYRSVNESYDVDLA